MLNGIAGTIGGTDIYGNKRSAVSGAADVLGVTNPNSNGVAPMSVQASGGGGAADGGSGPAIAWVGIVATLVLLRIALHAAKSA